MVMDPELFTRAKSKSHGGVAALPKQALKDGHFPDWEAVDGPLPEAPKSSVVFPKLVDEPEPDVETDADGEDDEDGEESNPDASDAPETEPVKPAGNTKSADKPSAKK